MQKNATQVVGVIILALMLLAFAQLSAFAQPQQGSLQINVDPMGAGVIVAVTGPGEFEAALVGDQVLTSLEPGVYEVTATLEGYQTAQETVEVQAGEVAAVMLTLQPIDAEPTPTPPLVVQPELGSLEITVDPMGVGVSGVVTGPAGFQESFLDDQTLVNLQPGVYQVTATLEGYQTAQETVEVQAGEVAAVMLTLQPIDAEPTPTPALVVQPELGSLEITVDPMGVGVSGVVTGPAGFQESFLDDQTLVNLQPGVYQVTATLEGYQTAQETVEVQAGEVAAVMLTLQPIDAEPTPTEQTVRVYAAVAPQVLTTNLATLAAAKVWQPGDPVIVVEDLKEAVMGELEQGEPAAEEGQDQPRIGESEPSATDVDVRELPSVEIQEPPREVPDLRESDAEAVEEPTDTQEIEPTTGAAQGLSAPIADFDGIPATGFLPPDTVGDVGPNHYIQMVNTAFAIFDKSGALLAGPSPINSLWSGFGGPCESENNGDPIVQYDHLADRWLLSQFALPGGAEGLHECIAISQTADPVSGGWFLYDFPTVDTISGNPVFPDYPKIGVWPDGYYMGTQRGFPGAGLDVWAFERNEMLSGNPARVIQFAVPAPSLFLMPSDLDGDPPPAGTPNFFARQIDGDRFGGADRLEVFAFSADWSNPVASTFTQVATLPTAPFDSVLCSATLLGACIPQPGTTVTLETLTVWLMWRLQYRNFGTHETLVTNHTVDANGADLAGIRWYELRRPPSGAWTIHQQGTYAPDAVHRWMGSAAMDQDGNIALGYSVSSNSVFPGIRYAGRLAGDPLGTLPQPEVTLVTGGGSQTFSTAPRWGNYSALVGDPTDDCTFWYTTEYYDATSAAGWNTRISSFKHPSCGVVPVPARMGYVWANNPTANNYTPSTTYSYNSSGGPITISRSGAGRYAVRFEGLGGNGTAGGHVQVTAYGSGPETCKVYWWSSGGPDFIVNVRCFNTAGNLVDTLYTVLVLWPPS